MAYATRDRARQAVGMVVVLAVAAVVASFLHLRSVSPAGERDEELARSILQRVVTEAGLPPGEQRSAAAIRAGLREFRFDDEDGGGRDQPDGAEPSDLTDCGFRSGTGLRDRIYARLFNVDDPLSREATSVAATATAQTALQQPEPTIGLSLLAVLTFSSAESAQQAFATMESPSFRECITRSAGGAVAEVQPLPVTTEGARSFGYRFGPPAAIGPLSPSADIVVLSAGRGMAFVMSLSLSGPVPVEQHQALLRPLAGHLTTELRDE